MDSDTIDRHLRARSDRAKRHDGSANRLQRATRALATSIIRNPIESATIATPPMALAIFAGQEFFEARHALLPGLGHAESFALILAAGVWGLVVGRKITTKPTGADVTQEARLERTVAEIGKCMLEVLDAKRGVSERVEELTAVVLGLSVKQNSLTTTRDNTEAVWTNLAPGSDYTTVNGPFRFDLVPQMGPDGKITFVPNVNRLRRIMLSRFKEDTALNRVNHILFIGDAENSLIPASVEQHLTVYRALQQIADAEHVNLRIEDIPRFYLVERARPPKSFFLGEYLLNGVRLPFVHTYSDHASMYGVPVTLLDDKVLTSYLTNEISDHEQLARALMASAPALTFADFEKRYGRNVAPPQIRIRAADRPRSVVIKLDVIDFGDGSFRV